MGYELPEGFQLDATPAEVPGNQARLPQGFVLDKLPEGFTLDEPTAQPQEQSDPLGVPEWGRNHPNLYGAYGAGKAILEQAISPAIETAGAIVGSFEAPIAGTALGYGIAKKGTDIIEDAYAQLGGEEPKQRTLKGEVLGSAKDVAETAAFGKAVEVAVAAPAAFRASKQALKKASSYAFDELPDKLYSSAIKLPTSKKWLSTLPGKEASKRTAAVQEGLSSKILPSDFGLAKIKKLEKEVRSQVDQATTILSGNPDVKIKVADVLEDGLKKAYSTAAKSSDPAAAKAVVDKVKEGFKGHGEFITPKNANAIKRQLYKEVKWGAETDPTKVVAKKGVAKELMFQLEELYPELQQLNKVDAARINLTEGIEKAVGRNANKDILGLGTKVFLTSPTSWPLAAWNATIGNPGIKARLAFALAKQNPTKYSRFAYPELPAGYSPAQEIAETGVYRYAPKALKSEAYRPSEIKTELRPGGVPSSVRNKMKIAVEKEEKERLKQLEKVFREAKPKKKNIGGPLIKPSGKSTHTYRSAPITNMLKGLDS